MNNKSTKKILILLTLAIFLAGSLLMIDDVAVAKVKRPSKVKSISTTSLAQGQVTVKWKKIKCKGYQLQIASDKKFKSDLKKINLGKNKTSQKVKKLTPGAKYYFRLRAYNKSGSKKKYGKWSKPITRKAHKHSYKVTNVMIGKTQKVYSCSCGKSIVKKIKNISDVEKTATKDQETQTAVLVKKKKVIIELPSNTNVDTSVSGSVSNDKGVKYNYTIYKQNNNKLIKNYKAYLTYHGCSTCALTTILKATVPKFADYTPDMVVKGVIKPVVGDKVFNANFSKEVKKGQMPLGLAGISAVLSYYGVDNKYVYDCSKTSATTEIRNHLKTGNPIIFTAPKSIYTSGAHTMIMLGLDSKGKVIVGDSVKRDAATWGNDRLIKYGAITDPDCNTVENIAKLVTNQIAYRYPATSYYWNGKRGNIGYILINPQD